MMLKIPNLQEDVLLAEYTTYRIGGPADYFVSVSSSNELIKAVSESRRANVPYFILGTGANILMSDKGFRGLVIHNQANSYSFDGSVLTAESGATIADLIVACTEVQLSGLEHFAGIPSSVGGSMRQNLHFLAPNRDDTVFIGEIVIESLVLDSNGDVQTVDKDYFAFGYDESILHHNTDVVLGVRFQLTKSTSSKIEAQIADNLAWRNAKQPQLTDFPSCGSVFKKIEGVGAGRLIDEAGLKGKKMGGIKVSPLHANYLINTGNATAQDVRNMIQLIQAEVYSQTGYSLEPEISFVGEE